MLCVRAQDAALRIVAQREGLARDLGSRAEQLLQQFQNSVAARLKEVREQRDALVERTARDAGAQKRLRQTQLEQKQAAERNGRKLLTRCFSTVMCTLLNCIVHYESQINEYDKSTSDFLLQYTVHYEYIILLHHLPLYHYNLIICSYE